MTINEDHDYRSDPFGVEAVFDVSGTSLSVWGHFTEATEGESLYPGVEIEANYCRFACNTSEVAAVKNEMTVVINDVTYTVKGKQRLGTGDSLFTLKT